MKKNLFKLAVSAMLFVGLAGCNREIVEAPVVEEQRIYKSNPIDLDLEGAFDAGAYGELVVQDGSRAFHIGQTKGRNTPLKIVSDGQTTVPITLFFRKLGNQAVFTYNTVADVSTVQVSEAGQTRQVYRLSVVRRNLQLETISPILTENSFKSGEWYVSGIVNNKQTTAQSTRTKGTSYTANNGVGKDGVVHFYPNAVERMEQDTKLKRPVHFSGLRVAAVDKDEEVKGDNLIVPIHFKWTKLNTTPQANNTGVHRDVKFEPLGFWLRFRAANNLAVETINFAGLYLHEFPFAMAAVLDATQATDADLKGGKQIPVRRMNPAGEFLHRELYMHGKDYAQNSVPIRAGEEANTYWYAWAIPAKPLEGYKIEAPLFDDGTTPFPTPAYTTGETTLETDPQSKMTVELMHIVTTADFSSQDVPSRYPTASEPMAAGVFYGSRYAYNSKRHFYNAPAKGYESGKVYDIQLVFDSEPYISEVYQYCPTEKTLRNNEVDGKIVQVSLSNLNPEMGLTAIEIYNPDG